MTWLQLFALGAIVFAFVGWYVLRRSNRSSSLISDEFKRRIEATRKELDKKD